MRRHDTDDSITGRRRRPGRTWLLASHPDPSKRDAERALRLANETLLHDRTPETLDTFAVALAALGEYKEALRFELDAIDLVLVPTGGGNLAGGCVTAIKAMQPRASVISVQSTGSPAVTESFHAGKALERPIDTIADGLVTRVPPRLSMSVLWRLLDDAWLCTDEELLAATHGLLASAHVLVEPAGAAGLAGACKRLEAVRGKRVVLILTGANLSTELLQRALATEPSV